MPTLSEIYCDIQIESTFQSLDSREQKEENHKCMNLV